jgi:hypothetical protein
VECSPIIPAAHDVTDPVEVVDDEAVEKLLTVRVELALDADREALYPAPHWL